MALLTSIRRVQALHSPLSLTFVLRAITHLSSSPSHRLSYLSFSFRHTVDIAFSHNLHFSTLNPFINQNSFDPTKLHDHVNATPSPHQLRLLELLERAKNFSSEGEALAFLDDSGILPDNDSICSVLLALRGEWKLAVLAFKWAEKWGCDCKKALSLIVWVLGTHKKFNTAWCLIREFHRRSIDARQAMLVMIDRYAAVNNPGKSIKTFHIMEKFRVTPDEEAFHTLLTTLCKNGNIEEAEEFMHQNKKLFPLDTESFNIILNGWCNISIDVFEAKRVWREMSRCCVTPNAASYACMISCFSKVGNLFDSLRLYDEMNKRGWVPCLEVYNSLIYVLTRENCFDEALKFLEKLKEAGFIPNFETYNSMIKPLCELKKIEEARHVLATMIGENIRPTIETYHALLVGTNFEGTLEVLNQMKKCGCGPNEDSFLLILNKFFKLEQAENSLKIWLEMRECEIMPNSAHYAVVVKGLAACGFLGKARELYIEMVSNGFLSEPKLKKLLKEAVRGKRDDMKKGGVRIVCKSGRVTRRRKHGKQSRNKAPLDRSHESLKQANI